MRPTSAATNDHCIDAVARSAADVCLCRRAARPLLATFDTARSYYDDLKRFPKSECGLKISPSRIPITRHSENGCRTPPAGKRSTTRINGPLYTVQIAHAADRRLSDDNGPPIAVVKAALIDDPLHADLTKHAADHWSSYPCIQQ
ncbi:hypothetical protein EVAR_60862_1 [Eumeta japonica]|uniref:Uncharacterized protein n=1 Tax=Eumeta variegata TaxID=151549 RepID=A0A4C1Y5Y3_EUMVA|nr:hypothetical protein EVAR_60862_1 [Eumeta japonica]